MKVILKEYVYKHGVAGDVVTVADGFARNYLIPRGLAIKATPGALRANQHLIKQSAQRREELRSMEHEAAQKIHGVELVFGVKAGKNRKLYGSITTRDIAQALLDKTGVDINRRRISERPLRELGVHEVPVRIAAHVSPMLRIVVIREEEVPAYQAGQQVPTLAGEQAFAAVEEEETVEAGKMGEPEPPAQAAALEPAGEVEQPGESAE
ncbi:MAG: 50S ribosomal protein L9 [Anaerolineae bacterium]|nr:50S ribosomal protein L9 [Anaerolineae bacterium]